MSKATLLLRLKRTDMDGDIIEQVVWQVPQDSRQPEGIRYRLAFIPLGAKRPAVLYDNHHPKGHHKHVAGAEVPVRFHDWERLMAEFEGDIALAKMSRGPAHESH